MPPASNASARCNDFLIPHRPKKESDLIPIRQCATVLEAVKEGKDFFVPVLRDRIARDFQYSGDICKIRFSVWGDCLLIPEGLVTHRPIEGIHPVVVEFDNIRVGSVVGGEPHLLAGIIWKILWKLQNIPYCRPSKSVKAPDRRPQRHRDYNPVPRV